MKNYGDGTAVENGPKGFFRKTFWNKAKSTKFKTINGDTASIIKLPFIFGRAGVPSGDKELWIYNGTKNELKLLVAEYFPDENSTQSIFSGQVILKDWDDNFITGYTLKNNRVDALVSEFVYTGVGKNKPKVADAARISTQYVCYYNLYCVETFTYITNHPEYGNFYRKDCYVENFTCGWELNIQMYPPNDVINLLGLLNPIDPSALMRDNGLITHLTGLNNLERAWALNNPDKVYRAKSNRDKARSSEQTRYCSSLDGGNNNAYKHAYWSALNYKYLGSEVALDIAWMHELGDANFNQTAANMDMHNNGIGFGIASTYPNASDEQLRDFIQNAIDPGQGVRLFNRDNPQTQIPTDASGKCNL